MSQSRDSSPWGKFSPAASEFLRQFQELDGQNKELQHDNAGLRDRLAAERNKTDHARDLQQNVSEQFERFCQQCIDLGASVTKAAARQTLEELFNDVQLNKVQISKLGVSMLQQSSVVRVHLLANIAGSEQCLIEHDRFNLLNGDRKILMIPLEVCILAGESWRQAAQRGLQMMVGLQPEWQENYTVLDEDSYICTHEERREDILGSLLSVTTHEVHARLKAANPSQDEDVFEQIGLPSGRDFVYCGKNSTVHVWCWKCREHEYSGRMKAFEKYLIEHGVNTAKLGVDDNKTLFQIYREVEEQKDCCLLELPGKDSKVSLQRVVQILEIKLVAEVNKRRCVLTETDSDDDRKNAGGKLVTRRMREGDDWQAVLPLAIAERFGISVDHQNECLQVDHDKMIYTEEVAPSEGFAGILSNYKIRTITVYVVDPDHEALECIGLPRGNESVTTELVASGAVDLHVWGWVLTLDDAEEVTLPNFGGTALEVLHRGLADVESMLVQTIADTRLSAAGLDVPFVNSLQKLKQCVSRLSNIDKTVKSVDVNDVMGKTLDRSATQTALEPKVVTGLQGFIESNFVRADAPLADDNAHRRVGSMDLTLDNLSGGFSLERLFSSGPPLLQTIMEGRNDWDLDLFDLAYKHGDESMLKSYGEVMVVPFCVNAFDTAESSARKFVHAAASQYLEENPYHGHIHAAQVCHLARWLTKAERIMEHQSELESTAFMLAGICHDIKHIGRNNLFCVTTEHPLALLYGNSAVLENYHSASCLQLLEQCQVLQNISLKERALVRSHIIENILATDMAEHFETISKFRVRFESPEFSIETEADRRFVARLCLKAGDLGHACLPWELHTEWCMRVLKEFYAQGDEEIRMGLPISALCDRKDIGSLEKSQKGFLEFVVVPLYRVMIDSQPPPNDDTEGNAKFNRRSSAAKRRSSLTLKVVGINFQLDQVCENQMKENVRRWAEDTEYVENIKKTMFALVPNV